MHNKSLQSGADADDARVESLRKWHVLVVEDVHSLQRLLQIMLQKAGHQVSLADNGNDAVRLVQEQRFDAVLMDIQMPGMSGLDAMRAIRLGESPTGRRLPIVAVTAHAQMSDAVSCRDAGADHFLRKPVDLVELMTVLRQLIDAPHADHDRRD
jgi:CheY-like chemotaxis protein